MFRGGKPIKFPTKRFKEWRADMVAQLQQQHTESARLWPLTGLLRLEVYYIPGDNVRRDMTGCADALFHLLEHIRLIVNDAQIKEVLWYEKPVQRGNMQFTFILTHLDR